MSNPPFLSMQVFLEQELRRIERSRAFIFMQDFHVIARELTFGVFSSIKVENVPLTYDPQELEQQLFQTQIKLNGEPLMTAYRTGDIIVLDNKLNRNIGSAAILPFPEDNTYLIVAFNQSDLAIDYVKAMEDLRTSFNKYRIFNYPQLRLNYQKPIIRPELEDDFSPDGYIKVCNYQLKYLNKVQEYDPERHRLCALFLLNPLYPTFNLNIDLIYQLQNVCKQQLFICVLVKGSTGRNIGNIIKQTKQLSELNCVQEYATFADKLLHDQAIYSFLVDMCPGASIESVEKSTGRYKLTQEKHLSQKIRDIISQPALFNDVEIPVIFHETADFNALTTELEQAFQAQLDQRYFKYDIESNTCQLYGIRNKLTPYNTQMRHKYTVVYFSKKLDCRQVIQKISELANVFICIKGVYQLTLKNAAQQINNLTQTCVIHDDNNVQRVVDDIFNSSGDHLLLFDEDFMQVGAEFGISELKQRIDTYDYQKREQQRLLQEEEEERLRLEQQRAAMAEDDIQFVETRPLINGFAEIPELPGAERGETQAELDAAGAELAAYQTVAGEGAGNQPENAENAAESAEVAGGAEAVATGAATAETPGAVAAPDGPEPGNAYEAIAAGAGGAGEAEAAGDAATGSANPYDVIAKG